ncbi:MAG: class I SAM-dependent methyltransferase [Austwickia sp.]|nr:class I SAM-dependent methyltransferase [Austwickia sp.]MBK8435436.1 class I SAM-dependent methyltransferase [Austwickia sp.]MBK9101015.1 class I SAM-dependent methyltransferase [Austwickia sp.]
MDPSSQDGAFRRPAAPEETVRANRAWWDDQAAEYLAEHGDFLGAADLVWGPEGLREEQARLLGDLRGRRVLEIGAGAAQGSKYVADQGGLVVATDLSSAMLRSGGDTAPYVPVLTCDARRLPFADQSFDVVFTAQGALPFVADPELLVAEAARVLRPGGRFVAATPHPIRWAFPDSPDERGLTATMSYFDRTPYVEITGGVTSYVEHHRTVGDRIRDLMTAGFMLLDLVEPEWPDGHDLIWGGWSPTRGRLLPGTAIYVAELLRPT